MSASERQLLLGGGGSVGGVSSSSSSARRARAHFADDTPASSPALLSRARRAQLQPQFQRSLAAGPVRTRLRRYFTFKEGSIAIFLVLAILLLLLLSIIGGLLLRPFFTFGILAAAGASLLFVATEASAYGAWHHNREAENRFWIVVAIILSATLVFAPDSPLSTLGTAFPLLGFAFVIGSAAWVHYYDRLLEREELLRAPHLRRVSSFVLTDQESTKQKLQVVQDCVAAGSAVALADGTALPIELVRPGARVLAWTGKVGGGLEARAVTAVLERGTRQCVELLLDNGRTLTCTADHRVLTAEGRWVRAHSLDVGKSQLAVGAEQPLVDELEDEHTVWRLDGGALLGVLDMQSQRARSLAFARLMGRVHAESAGSSGACGADGRGCTLRFEHAMDVRACLDDIELLIGGGAAVFPDGASSVLVVPRLLRAALLQQGAQPSASATQATALPLFITAPECPVGVVREFVGALLAAGSRVSLPEEDETGAAVAAFPTLSWCCAKQGVAAHEQALLLHSQLLPLLQRCAVASRGAAITAHGPALQSLAAAAVALPPAGQSTRNAVQLSLSDAALASFARRVGFRYSGLNQLRLTAAAALLRTAPRGHSSVTEARRSLRGWGALSLFQSDADPSAFSAADSLPLLRAKLLSRRSVGAVAVFDLTVPSAFPSGDPDADDLAASFTANSFCVHNCLAALDYRFVAAKAINQSQILAAERDIVRTLQECEKSELNYILTNVNLSLLFYKIKDKDLLTFNKAAKDKDVQHRTRVLELLARERLADLNVQARVVVLDALMNMRLKAHTSAEALVRDIIMATKGRMLTRMKNACDLKGRAQNFHKLIYRDISSASIRAEIIAHLSREGEVVKNDGLLPRERLKVLSDVDDTLTSSGGHFPAGIDQSYPHHMLYPGVCTFYKELDLGAASSTGEWEEGRQGNLVFLSARPHVYKDKSEKKSYKKFEELRLMKNVGLHCVPTLLSGSLDSGFQMFRGLYEPMSTKKFENFTQYATLYPEFKFCFIGDNGQGDVRAGELMKEALQDQVVAIFIHQVQPLHRTPGYVNYDSLARWDRLGIFFFRTYIGAALQALRLRMIHSNGLRRIAADAISYFLDLKASRLMPLHTLDARRTELNRDIEAADSYLRLELGQSVGLHSIPADCIFHVGSCVETAWGVGVVSRFNSSTGIYTVLLSDWTLQSGPVRVHIHGSDIMWHTKGQVGDAVNTRFGTGVLTEIRELNGVHVIALREWGHAASLSPLLPHASSNLPSTARTSSSPYAYLQPADFEVIVAGVGDHVWTEFGQAVVIKYRAPCTHVKAATAVEAVAAAAAVAGSSAASSSAPLGASQSDSIVSVSVPPPTTEVFGSHSPCLTTVGIYVCKLNWGVAFLNGQSIQKIAEPAQRRCVVM